MAASLLFIAHKGKKKLPDSLAWLYNEGMNIRDWVRAARAHKGWTQTQLGNAVGRTKANIGHWETGKHSPSTEQLVQISIATGHPLPPMGAGVGMESRMVQVQAGNSPTESIPLVGQIRCDAEGAIEDLPLPPAQEQSRLEYWSRDPQAYGLRVKGDSLHPRYRAGEYLIATPGIDPTPGCDVIVQLKNGRKFLKLMNWLRSDEVQFFNVSSLPTPATYSLDEIQSLHRIACSLSHDTAKTGQL